MLLAGFRLGEPAMVRALLDAMQAQHVKVIVCGDAELHTAQQAALQLPEVDWTAPREEGAATGGSFGSQRAVLFAGLSHAQRVRAPALIK